MKIFAETERLILREILPTDAEGMFELDSDPDVHKYLGNKTVSSKNESIDVISFIRQQYRDNGVARWAIIDKKTNDFVGWAGLKFVTDLMNNHINYHDIGYRLIKRYWGQGIATEAAIASLRFAFDTLHLNEVYAVADCENKGSNRILSKIGLKFIETFDLDGVKHNWYKIDQKEYENIRHTSVGESSQKSGKTILNCYWKEFQIKNPAYADLEQPPSYYFCDNKKDADECAELIALGIKQATTHSLSWFHTQNEALPTVGDLAITTNWAGVPKAVIKTTKVEIVKFKDITAEYAFIEGEGDKGLAYWKNVHWEYYTREMKDHNKSPSLDMELVCEYFETIHLPHDR